MPLISMPAMSAKRKEAGFGRSQSLAWSSREFGPYRTSTRYKHAAAQLPETRHSWLWLLIETSGYLF